MSRFERSIPVALLAVGLAGAAPCVSAGDFRLAVEGGAVQGTMDPYHDPQCDCQVNTTFVGRISGDTIEGTFTTTPSGAGAQCSNCHAAETVGTHADGSVNLVGTLSSSYTLGRLVVDRKSVV